MAKNKYPEYVTTDSDLWNSADEAYFFVVKEKAKPLTNIITPIIEDALESGMLREATQEEIEDYELDHDIEKRVREKRFNVGKTRKETIEIYLKWKEAYEKNGIPKPLKDKVKIEEDVIDVDGDDDYVEVPKKTKIGDKKPSGTTTTTETPSNSTITTKGHEPPITKTLTPTENALKQKATIRSDNM